MKKLLILVLVAVAGYFVWKGVGPGTNDAISELQHRLDAAERSYQQAGRTAGLAGVDTTADASAALREIARVESALRDLSRTASPDDKRRIEVLLARVGDVKRRIG